MRTSSSRGGGRDAREPGHVLHHEGGRQVDPLAPCRQPVGQLAAAERTEVDAGRSPAELGQGDAARPAAEQLPDEEGGARGQPGPLHQPLLERGLAVQAGGRAQGDLAEDLPVVALVGLLVEHRRGEAGRVAHGQQVEDQVVVVALERRGGRQDHVGVPGGLVDVDVHGGHEVEVAQRAVEPGAVGRGQHRVAGDGEQGPDLPLAGRLDLLAQRRHGQLAGGLRQPADPRAPGVVVPAADQPGAHRVDRRGREHRAAGAVEVAGEHVEAGDRPLAHGAPRAGGHTDPAVDDTGVRRRELAGEAADLVGRQPADRLGALGGELGDELDHRVQPVDVRRHGGRRPRPRR